MRNGRTAARADEGVMSNYGKIDYVFYDGEWIPGVEGKRTLTEHGESSETAEAWRAKELNAMVRSLQPHIIINNRSGLDEDMDTPEQSVIASKEGRCWESCMTIGDSCGWGYIKHMLNLKSVPQLIQYLVTAATGAGNYLLNIGPKPDGSVQKEFTDRLKEIGKWMKKNGESIYGSERTTLYAGMIGQTTAKGNTVYYHIYRWPGKEAVVPGLKNNVLSARILATGKKVGFEKTQDGKLCLKGLPPAPPDKYDTVIAVEVDGKTRTIRLHGYSPVNSSFFIRNRKEYSFCLFMEKQSGYSFRFAFHQSVGKTISLTTFRHRQAFTGLRTFLRRLNDRDHPPRLLRFDHQFLAHQQVVGYCAVVFGGAVARQRDFDRAFLFDSRGVTRQFYFFPVVFDRAHRTQNPPFRPCICRYGRDHKIGRHPVVEPDPCLSVVFIGHRKPDLLLEVAGYLRDFCIRYKVQHPVYEMSAPVIHDAAADFLV